MSDGAPAPPPLWRGALLAAVSGLLYFAAFPPLDAGGLAFVALVPLLLALRRRSRGHAFLLGWLSGTIGICALVSGSIYGAAARYFGDGSAVLAFFAFIVPQVHGALYFGFFAALVAGWEKRGSVALLALPAAWTACELARSTIGYGAPWVLLGHSQHARLWLAQIADLGGVFAVSFAVALVNTALASLLEGRAAGRTSRRDVVTSAAVTAAVLVAVFAYGERQLRRWSPEQLAGARLRVAVVQPNLPLAQRASLTAAVSNLTRLVELTGTVAADTDLVVWPENAVGFSLAANPQMLVAATQPLPENGRLLLGAPRELATPTGVVFRNSAFLLDRGGGIVGSYDKLRLTPFAETSPWNHVPLLHQRFAADDVYTPGDAAELLAIHDTPTATLICYEAIYPDLAARAVRAGARLLVNISNDDWFGGRPALAQHLDATLFRAIETRRFLVRATNSGLSAVIDPRGVLVASAPPAEATTMSAEVTALDGATAYVRWGDAFAWMCLLVTVAFVFTSRRSGAR